MLDRLRIISADSVISFESACTDRIEKIADEISRKGKLGHPILVHPLDGKYLLLDNVNVFLALSQLHIDHIPVQLADPKTVSVRPWQRLIMGLSKADIFSFCETLPLKIHMIDADNGALQPNHLEIRFRSGGRVRAAIRAESALVRADVCNRLYREIARRHKMFRGKVDYHARDPFAEYPDASAILFPPMFSLDELTNIARHGESLPHGFIRSDQPERVLGIDFSLSVLAERASIEEKESFLRDMLKLRVSLDRIAYYNGAIFMYNG